MCNVSRKACGADCTARVGCTIDRITRIIIRQLRYTMLHRYSSSVKNSPRNICKLGDCMYIRTSLYLEIQREYFVSSQNQHHWYSGHVPVQCEHSSCTGTAWSRSGMVFGCSSHFATTFEYRAELMPDSWHRCTMAFTSIRSKHNSFTVSL